MVSWLNTVSLNSHNHFLLDMYASYQPPIGETKAWSVNVKTGHEFFKAATACFHMQREVMVTGHCFALDH
jgi:hypothetical protein